MYKLLISILLFFPNIKTEIPELNRKILEYVESRKGEKVGRGECWDLAAEALSYAGAYLDRSSQKTIYVFGKKLNPQKDDIFPGDIIQIENLKLEYMEGNTIYTENMSHHTAIIYEVLKGGAYEIAHQNTSFSGRKVGISELNMKYIKKGKILFYRPYKK